MRILFIRAESAFVQDSPSTIRTCNLINTWVGRHDCEVDFCQYVLADDLVKAENVFKLAKKKFIVLSRRYYGFLLMLDRFVGIVYPWGIHGFLRTHLMLRYLRKNYVPGSVDLVVCTLPYHSGVHVASRAARYLQCKWVGDFRDLPDEFDPDNKKLRTRITVRSVRHALRAVEFCSVVSPDWVEPMRNRYGVTRTCVAMNGYEGTLPVSSDFSGRTVNEFCIFYAGTLAYNRMLGMEMLLSALDDLMHEDPGFLDGVVVAIAGDQSDDRWRRLAQYKSFARVRKLGRLPRAKVLEIEQQSSLLVNIASPEAPGVLPSKIFEYAKARRPVMNLLSSNDLLGRFVCKSRIGCNCVTADEVRAELKRLVFAWRTNGFVSDPPADFEFLKEYSRETQAEIFFEHIEKALAK